MDWLDLGSRASLAMKQQTGQFLVYPWLLLAISYPYHIHTLLLLCDVCILQEKCFLTVIVHCMMAGHTAYQVNDH